MQVVLILVPAAWLAVVLFALAICRVGARGDETEAQALVDWVEGDYVAELAPPPIVDDPVEALPWEDHGPHWAAG
jgi:hypothetical protein